MLDKVWKNDLNGEKIEIQVEKIVLVQNQQGLQSFQSLFSWLAPEKAQVFFLLFGIFLIVAGIGLIWWGYDDKKKQS